MHVDELDYPLPPSAIAQRPLQQRDSARLLVDRGASRAPAHRHVRDLPDLLGPGDVVVLNTTRVMAARLSLRKATGGAIEVLLLSPAEGGGWEALVRPGRRVPPGTALHPVAPTANGLWIEAGEELGDGRRRVHLRGVDDAMAAVAAVGAVPLPPYIREPLDDVERYQTVFGRTPTSAAAPTAGLHLTHELLDRIRAAGAEVAELELDVGLGTFRPIATTDVDDHTMHAEAYRVPEATLAACRGARRVVAVGTTVVRALESARRSGAAQGRTTLFIRGPEDLGAVDVLVTNFHLPRSSLLVLVQAFVGPRWRDLYETALAHDYRFLSFGDAMVVAREGAVA